MFVILAARMQRQNRIVGFVDTIWQWYVLHKRILPWRDLSISSDTERAYRILVSEIMLQQTQVERVRVTYCKFLDQFPLLRDLALASNSAVIQAWRGMGYNSRALRLRDAARVIVERHHGMFPEEMEDLQAIQGIGHYTAAAIRNFAFNIGTPCIDTNIRRILHRTFVGPERADGTWKKDDRYLLKIAEEVLEAALFSPFREVVVAEAETGLIGESVQSPHDARNWHAALMDFGSLVQTKKHPKWAVCPLTSRKLMVTTCSLFERAQKKSSRPTSIMSKAPQEPGRHILGRFVPNRIVRGRIVEALRDSPSGLTLQGLGQRVAADWSPQHHRIWLQGILRKLAGDRLVEQRAQKFQLKE